MKKFYLYTIFLLFLFNNSFACQLLNVPIGSNINTAAQTFEFVDTYEEGAYEEEASVVFFDYAEDFCQGSNLKDTELEVIIYQSKLAGINLVNLDQNNKMPTITEALMTPDIYIPILALLIIFLITLIFRKKFFKN